MKVAEDMLSLQLHLPMQLQEYLSQVVNQKLYSLPWVLCWLFVLMLVYLYCMQEELP